MAATSPNFWIKKKLAIRKQPPETKFEAKNSVPTNLSHVFFYSDKTEHVKTVLAG